MNNIPMTVNSITLLPDCWLYEKKHYLLKTSSSLEERLPYLDSSFESVLKDLKIPYRSTIVWQKTMLEYWDPTSFEEKEICLPLYIPLTDGSYKFVKNYTGKIPTQSSIVAANKLTKKVNATIKKDEIEKGILELKNLLHGKKAAGFNSDMPRYYEKDFVTEKEHLKVLPVQIIIANFKSPTGCFVVFDVNEIELNSELNLPVPKDLQGLFIGKQGWQIKEWCKKLGLKRINVIGI